MIVCQLNDTAVSGDWTVVILTADGFLPSTIDAPINVPIVVNSVTPNSDVNPLGGDRLVIAGTNFGYDTSSINVTFADGTTCPVLSAANTAGAKFPEVVAAQWALESGWGKHTSGKNNYFGIKGITGKGSLVRTTEFIAGVEQKVDAWFKDYPSLQDCVTDLVNKWYKDYKGYKGVNRATSPDECAELLIQEGYATDPNYVTKLINIMRRKDD